MKLATVGVLILLLVTTARAEHRGRLELTYRSLELPAAPTAIVSADLDDDGQRDLVIAVVYSSWDQISIEESTRMNEVEGLVEVLTIVPALFDRREIRLYRRVVSGDRFELAAAMPMPSSVLSLEAGPPGLPVVVLTDDGLAALRLRGASRLELEPVIEERPILAHTETFVPDLHMTHDLDTDGDLDYLLPGAWGPVIYLSHSPGLAPQPTARLALEADYRDENGTLHYPLPEVRDVDGDDLPDLLMPHHARRWQRFRVRRNLGSGRFGTPIEPLSGERNPVDTERGFTVVYFGDLDGDGRAEYVTQEDLTDEDEGLRKEMRQAKRPPLRFRLFRSLDDLSMENAPYETFDAEGYAFEDDKEAGAGEERRESRLPAGFHDLNGDGRQDLILLTLDFSVFQALRVLTVKSLNIGLDFHIWCQTPEGRFQKVDGLDLSGRFRFHLDDLRIGRLSQFGGDFDGDGRIDFVQMGRGREVTIHRGQDGCRYPPTPDLALELKNEPRDLGLVRVGDHDGDGLSDLLIIQPQRNGEPGVATPVRLDLYLSGDE